MPTARRADAHGRARAAPGYSIPRWPGSATAGHRSRSSTGREHVVMDRTWGEAKCERIMPTACAFVNRH